MHADVIDLGDITTARGAEMLLPIWLRLWGALGTPMFNFKIVRQSPQQRKRNSMNEGLADRDEEAANEQHTAARSKRVTGAPPGGGHDDLGATAALIATKFPPGMRSTAEDMPRALEGSLAWLGRTHVDLYQHHYPTRRVSIPQLMDLMADAVAAGKVKPWG